MSAVNIFTVRGNMLLNQAKYALEHWDEVQGTERGWNKEEFRAAIETAEGTADYQI